ncbi:MAG TPA: hypothetical protein VK636_09600 [Gemmatimonadaceae bacterium]|nr:hypothetical protein [Gemmatimonadaceae bacterium]
MARTRSSEARKRETAALNAVTTPHVDVRLKQAESELEHWRARAIPDVEAPLDADDVARLVRGCFDSLGVDAAAGESFSVNTVHYYRRKDILDEPEGRTSAARYTVRHVWQAAGARLAGFLGLVTLAEARESVRGATEPALRRFVAARIADARGQQATRDASTTVAVQARPLHAAAPIPATTAHTATVIPLGGAALCLVPAGHAALRSPAAARALVESLAIALGLDP